MPRQSVMWLGLAFVVGLIVALSVAFAKDLIAASMRIRTPDELQTALGDVPVLAWVPDTARRRA
jgi:capsular polysaccharide biosynthesis protein